MLHVRHIRVRHVWRSRLLRSSGHSGSLLFAFALGNQEKGMPPMHRRSEEKGLIRAGEEGKRRREQCVALKTSPGVLVEQTLPNNTPRP